MENPTPYTKEYYKYFNKLKNNEKIINRNEKRNKYESIKCQF